MLLTHWALATNPQGDLTFMLNDTRSRGMDCAGQSNPQSVGLLTYNAKLEQAALMHARNMGQNNLLSHVFAGLGPRERVRQVGYNFLRLSEIFYKGAQPDPLRALEWWLNSPIHCQAIMNPHYTESG